MKLLLTSLAFFSLCTAAMPQKVDNTPITKLDLDRYLGRWYEIARYDHSFERGLVGCMADYSLRDDGKIKVLNSGYIKTLDGDYKESVGKARVRKNGKPGQLQVSFFSPFYADYDILELAPDYSYSVVGSSSPRYLWILSRTPHLNGSTKGKILKNLSQRGYDISKLIWVEQK